MDREPNLVSVVILNTNRRSDTLECLQSVTQSTYKPISIMVLDNASTDGSVEAIQIQYPGVELVHLDENKGYAGNNNVGIKKALAQNASWVLILNEDTIMSTDCIEKMVNEGEKDHKIGIVGPLVFHYDEPSTIQSAGASMNRFWQSHHVGMNEEDRGQYCEVKDVDWVSGCAIMIRRNLLEQLGGYDERFFYYNEETEFCFRARLIGSRNVIVPQAKLWHKGVKRNYQPGPSIGYYSTRNQFLFLEKHGASLWVRIYNWLYYSRTVISMTIRPKWKDKKLHRDAMLQGMHDFIFKRWGRRPE